MGNNLDDFLTTYMLTEMPAYATEIKAHNGLILNLLKLKQSQGLPEGIFDVITFKEHDKEETMTYSLQVNLKTIEPYLKSLPFVAEQLNDLATSADTNNAARIHMSDFNKLTPEIKSQYKLVAPNSTDQISLEDWHVSTVEGNTEAISFFFKETGAMDKGAVNQASTVFRDILRYNILYVMLIQAFKSLKVDIDAINDADNPETKKNALTGILNRLTPEFFTAIADEVESTLLLNFKMIAESFLRKNGQALTEEILRFYDAYSKEIPDIFYSKDINEKVFIESLTRVYKTLCEAIDTELVGKAGEVNKKIKDKATKIKLGKLNREKIINNFLKNDVLSQKEKFLLVMEEMKNKLLEIANGKIETQAPAEGAAEAQPSATPTETEPMFNLNTAKDLVDKQLDFYQNAYDNFIQKIK